MQDTGYWIQEGKGRRVLNAETRRRREKTEAYCHFERREKSQGREGMFD
ncbi:MAG: hypothetical protein IPM56_15945 [Ignavibacteriales bacterium]|nr:MAG: hypothetical protein IPM56_15945 [Ignavibacteriales bacterium]